MLYFVITKYSNNKQNYTRIWLVLSYGLLEEKRKDDVTANNILLLYLIKQIDSVLLWVCIVIDHRRSQNVVKHRWHTRLRLIGPFVLTTCCRHFWSIMNKRTEIWNLSVKFIYLFIYLFFILAWYWLKPATLLLSLWHCWIKWNIPTSSYWGASGCHDRNLSKKPLLNRSLADSFAQLHVLAWARHFKDRSAREIWFLLIFVELVQEWCGSRNGICEA